jgi:hypothetical protein
MFAAMLGAISAIESPTACHTVRLRRNEPRESSAVVGSNCVAISSSVERALGRSLLALNRKEKTVIHL